MAAAENRDQSWLDLQRRREERMRYEVLSMLYDASSHCVDLPVDVAGFVKRLGVWEDELTRVLDFLTERGYIRRSRDAPDLRVCLTVQGADYLQRDAGRRRTIRD